MSNVKRSSKSKNISQAKETKLDPTANLLKRKENT